MLRRHRILLLGSLVVALSFAGVARSAEAERLPAASPVKSPAPKQAGPAPAALDPAALEGVLAGEFELQAGDLPAAAHSYLQAARAIPDAGLAERATRIALLAGDDAAARDGLVRWRQLAPRSAGVTAAGAALALRAGDHAAALQDLLTLLSLSVDEGWKRALQTLAGHRDGVLVGDLLGEILDRDALPDVFQAWLAFGGLAQRLQRDDLAERIVDGAVARFPGEPRAWLLQASRYRQQGREIPAREAIAKALTAAPDDPSLRLAAAGELDALGDSRAAADALATGRQDNASYATRASLLAKAEDQAQLAELYQEVKQQSGQPDPQRRLLLGQLAEYLELPDDALAWYRGVSGGPARGQARLRIAVVLEQQDRLDAALAELHALQADEDEDGELLRSSYQLEAELQAKRKHDAEAVAAYGRGLAVFEDDPELLYARALTYERMDRIDLAEADLKRVLSNDGDNADVLNALGYTLADRTRRYEEALEYIQKAHKLKPEQPAIIDSLGWVLYRLGRREEALNYLKQAYALQKDPEIAAHLGELLWVTGDKAGAREIWNQGLTLDKDNRALRRALETFKP